MKGYCVKCKQKREMKKLTKKKMGGKLLVKGVCGKCGTNMAAFVKA